MPSYAQKAILGYLPQIYVLGPSPHVRLNFPKIEIVKLFIIKLWLNWQVVCKNLTSGCQVVPKKQFLAHLPHNFVLAPAHLMV